jgi:hypothetical protein
MKQQCLLHSALCCAGAVLMSVAVTLSAHGDTDICGNEIQYNTDGTIKYQFIKSGDPRPFVGCVAVDASSHKMASNDDVGIVALFKSAMSTIGGSLYSTPWLGFFLIVR